MELATVALRGLLVGIKGAPQANKSSLGSLVVQGVKNGGPSQTWTGDLPIMSRML